MADNTVTLVVNGEVSLETFTKALADFNELIQGLNEEAGASVEWIIQDLQVSSAVVASMGKGEEKQVQNVVLGYEDVAAALEQDQEIHHSPRVKKAAIGLVSLPDKRVPSVLMQTARRDAIALNRTGAPTEKVITVEPRDQETADILVFPKVVARYTPYYAFPSIVPAYGAIEGRVQTLTNRGGLRFTLYDMLYDKAVSCFVTEEKKELLRGIWGKLAVVEGLIARDPENGRPLSVRDIRDISLLPEPGGPAEYQDARGAAPSLNKLSPEEAIRRIRDAQ